MKYYANSCFKAFKQTKSDVFKRLQKDQSKLARAICN